MEITADQRTISAREGLLDAVEALGAHGDAVILVGAQAIYVHTGEAGAGFAVSPFTYDADIALDPALLGNAPTDYRCHEQRRLQSDRPAWAVQKGERRTG